MPRTDELHRRPPGSRIIVYLDQCALSNLAKGRCPELRAVLEKGVRAGRVVCPQSEDHEDETARAKKSTADEIDELADELSMGVRFLDRQATLRSEVTAAAERFLGLSASKSIFEEAFNEDPHAPLDRLADSGRRVSKTAYAEADADDLRALSRGLQPYFDATRRSTATYEEQNEEAYRAMLRMELGPLVDPARYRVWLEEAAREARAAGFDGEPWRRHIYRQNQALFVRALVQRYPALAQSAQLFVESDALRAVPWLRLFALLFTSLLCSGGRNAKEGDLHDLNHLTRGLSRCDFVTADAGMATLCRQRGLVPRGVELFAVGEIENLARAIASRLAGAQSP